MQVFVFKFSAVLVALVFSTFAHAMEPLNAISPRDQDYNYYSAVVNMDQKIVNDGLVTGYSDFNMFNVSGRVVPLRDGSPSNPFNLVLTVNGNLYYVDAILNSVDSFKIRRRWVNNPEPGVFLRLEGRRVNPEDGRSALVTVWIKIATPEGRALPVLKVLEGNYDLAATVDPASLSFNQNEPGPKPGYKFPDGPIRPFVDSSFAIPVARPLWPLQQEEPPKPGYPYADNSFPDHPILPPLNRPLEFSGNDNFGCQKVGANQFPEKPWPPFANRPVYTEGEGNPGPILPPHEGVSL